MSKTLQACLVFLLLSLMACATGQPEKTTLYPAFKGKPFASFLVLGFSDNYKQRKAFEATMAQAMQSAGLKAAPSLSFMSAKEGITAARVKSAARKAKAEAVLVAYYAGAQETEKPVAPAGAPDYGALPAYFAGVGSYVGRRDYSARKRYQTLNCSIYDLASEKRIWKGSFGLQQAGGVNAMTRELATVVLSDLKGKGVIP